MFVLCWGIFLPFVIFEILICLRDENGNLSALSVVSPLLALFLVLFILSLNFTYRYMTSFDIARANRRQDEVGSRLLYDV